MHILTGEPVTKPDLSVTAKTEAYQDTPVTRLAYDFLRRSAIIRAAYSDPLVTAHIQQVMRQLQPDVVHATSLSLLMGGTIEAATNLKLPLVYTATDFVLTCRRGTYVKADNTVCAIKEEPAACTVCMGPQTALERGLERTYWLLPERLGQPALALAESAIGKRADFVHAAASIQHRFAYVPHWRPKISHIIAPSSYMREMLVLNDFPADRITVSPYGVEPVDTNFKKEPAPILRFGFIGRITHIKGVHLLLEAFAALPKEARQQARLTIYGSADVRSARYMTTIEQQVADFPQIRLAGQIDNADISQVYRQIDLLVVPSLWPENSPITILEAQAHGVPVIASNVGGIGDLVHPEVNGLIFANQSVEELTQQLARCLAEPTLVSHLAHHSRLIRSIDQDAGDLLELYYGLTGSG